LNDEHDPFTRSPLKISEVIELPELKARIEKWIEQKKAGVAVTDEDLRRQEKDSGMKDEEEKKQEYVPGEEEYSPELFQSSSLNINHGLQMTFSQGYSQGGDQHMFS